MHSSVGYVNSNAALSANTGFIAIVRSLLTTPALLKHSLKNVQYYYYSSIYIEQWSQTSWLVCNLWVEL